MPTPQYPEVVRGRRLHVVTQYTRCVCKHHRPELDSRPCLVGPEEVGGRHLWGIKEEEEADQGDEGDDGIEIAMRITRSE